MADQFPSIVPVGFAGDYTDFLKCKVDRSGAVRRSSGAVSVPGTTAQAVVIGLFPFEKGMSFADLSGFNLLVADLDSGTTVTLSVGVFYQNSTEGTDVLTLITNGSTAAQAGGYIVPGAVTTWQDYQTTGNGWVVVSVTAGPTTTTGNLTFNYTTCYDQPSLVA